MQFLSLFLIRLYQHTLSPDHGPLGRLFGIRVCRFVPTCSDFAHEAIRKEGFLRGTALALARFVRCHPWHPGGYDPVP